MIDELFLAPDLCCFLVPPSVGIWELKAEALGRPGSSCWQSLPGSSGESTLGEEPQQGQSRLARHTRGTLALTLALHSHSGWPHAVSEEDVHHRINIWAVCASSDSEDHAVLASLSPKAKLLP